MILNMLQQYRQNSELLYHEQVYDIHHFEQTPLSLLVYMVKIHENLHKQLTYAPKSVDVWYLRPAVHNYRCYNIDTGG